MMADSFDFESKLRTRKVSHDPKVTTLRIALGDRDPFYSGTCTLPVHQRHLYYGHGDPLRRLDFSNAGIGDLEALYRACKPAEFGRNGEDVFDESYRKAGKMELTSFATLFDPHSLRIHEQVSQALLTQTRTTMDMELYKLNVYGKGDFFKAHQDTPRGQDMFGSLVVVLPTPHKGGELVLRQGDKKWTIDFSDKFATATEPSVCFVAFFGDIEHEVLPVTAGYRVTLTYNLYHNPIHPSASTIPTSSHLNIKQALVDLLKDKSKLTNGGYLGFGLAHQYVHDGHNLLDQLAGQLKGSDRALANVCNELGLCYSFRLLYRGVDGLNFITTKTLEVDPYDWEPPEDGYDDDDDSLPSGYLGNALQGLTTEQAEGVSLVGGSNEFKPEDLNDEVIDAPLLRLFYRSPVTEILEVTRMKSSVDVSTPYHVSYYGNHSGMGFFYGTACMLVAVGPVESRGLAGL